MHTLATEIGDRSTHPVDIRLEPVSGERNRLTAGFRMLLVLPHTLLVGAPLAAVSAVFWRSDIGWSGGGVLGAVAGVCALIAWFSILFNRTHPQSLRKLSTFYLQWRVRALAYAVLLRDEYPPFGDGPYPAGLVIDVPEAPDAPRDRVSVGFRFFLAIPHLLALWVLGVAWCLVTLIAWVVILFTGEHPEGLYQFSAGVLRWNTRVEAYLLLLHDEYPPFSLE